MLIPRFSLRTILKVITVCAVLFLTVWCVYNGDRLFDVWRNKSSGDLESRHQFVGRHFRLMAATLVVVGAVAGGMAVFLLSADILKTGFAVAVLVVLSAYFLFNDVPTFGTSSGSQRPRHH